MSEVTREERGWAGHYICANLCRFRRNTLLTCGARRIVVSTVGAQETRARDGFEEIGLHRYYETMAFEAEMTDGYWDADVHRQVDFAAPWRVIHVGLSADAEANAMHEAVVAELTAKLAAGALPEDPVEETA